MLCGNHLNFPCEVTSSVDPGVGHFSAISCPAWWGIYRSLHAIKTNPHLYPGLGGLGVYFDCCIMRTLSAKEIRYGKTTFLEA